MVERGVQAGGIVEAMDVAGDGGVCSSLGFIHAGGLFVLERGEETLGHGVTRPHNDIGVGLWDERRHSV